MANETSRRGRFHYRDDRKSFWVFERYGDGGSVVKAPRKDGRSGSTFGWSQNQAGESGKNSTENIYGVESVIQRVRGWRKNNFRAWVQDLEHWRTGGWREKQ